MKTLIPFIKIVEKRITQANSLLIANVLSLEPHRTSCEQQTALSVDLLDWRRLGHLTCDAVPPAVLVFVLSQLRNSLSVLWAWSSGALVFWLFSASLLCFRSLNMRNTDVLRSCGALMKHPRTNIWEISLSCWELFTIKSSEL